jgi:8-amino-7-oxononanoate synthase
MADDAHGFGVLASDTEVPLDMGTLSKALERAGFLVVAIRPPTVPAGTARLRFTFSAAHEEAQVDALADTLVPALSREA